MALRPPRSGVRLGSLPVNSEEDLRFVQERLALFGKVVFFVSLGFLVGTSLADLTTAPPRYTPLARASHVLGTLVALGVWRLGAARRGLTPNQLQLLDVVGTLGACASFAWMGHFALQPYGFYTGLLATTYVGVTRAMIVPSLPRQTFWLGIAGFASLVVSRAIQPLTAEVALIAVSRPRGIIEAALWAAAGTAATTVASKVIYGLQERAREAQQLGQYVLEERIGEGGMGEVYRARHAMLRRETAVKLLPANGSESQLRRFEKEVQLTARLTHPNTISIFDYGRTPEGVFYYAMELLEGLTLEQLVQQYGPLPPGRVIHLLLQVCGALREAHRIGLIHRDIKPANIYLCQRGDVPDFVKVLDFGLVREMKSDGNVSGSNIHSIVGTPLYLAPEAIAMPEQIDARADLYGLGGVAYFLATGTPPFSGNNVVELCAHHLHTIPQRPSERHPVPEDLERVILACLAKDRGARPQTAQALVQLLEECRDAGAWTEVEAEAWWKCHIAAQPVPAPPPVVQGEVPRRTICCADFAERCRRRNAAS